MEDEIRPAVKKLLASGFRLNPDVLPYLQKTSNVVAVVNALINRRSTLPQTLDQHIVEKVGYDLEKSSLSSSIKNIVPLASELSSDSSISYYVKKSVITTKDSMLYDLNDFESQLDVIWEPQFSNNSLASLDDQVSYFQDRFSKLSNMFRQRSDISEIVKIRYLSSYPANSNISVIAMITEKQFPTAGGGILTLEDPTSVHMLTAIIPKSNYTLLDVSNQLLVDSVVCVIGQLKNQELLIVNDILLPDIPALHPINKSDIPVHAAFLSDIHIGSKEFLEKPFLRFIDFLQGKFGSHTMQQMGKMTKYVLFAGDIVDGVGVYPNQENELNILGIKEQYDEFLRYIDMFPDDVEIVVIPGNHDQVRAAEPQPKIPQKYTPKFHSSTNIHMLPNPVYIKMHGVNTFLYHCTSLPDILNSVPGLRTEKPAQIMAKMLQARHLAPVWDTRTPIAAEPIDNLVIESIPDLFHGGHIHINDMSVYNGVRIINSGTMQAQTSYQKALNIVPTPGEVIVMNLKTLSPNLLRLWES